MFSLLAQLRYGFFGLHGFIGVVLAVLLCVVIIWGIWKVLDILTAKFSTPDTSWLFQIARVILTVCTVTWFVNTVFGLGWW